MTSRTYLTLNSKPQLAAQYECSLRRTLIWDAPHTQESNRDLEVARRATSTEMKMQVVNELS